MYAHKATADISLLGVRMPPPDPNPPTATITLELYSVSHSVARFTVGLGGGRAGHGGQWCGLSKKKKAENRIGHFFSLRVQMHTYPPAVALCLMPLVLQVFSPQNLGHPAFLETALPLAASLCAQFCFCFGTDI